MNNWLHLHQMNNRNSRGATLLVAVLASVLLFVLGDAFLGKHQVCLYNSWFGVPCPLCGITRAVYELMHLRFVLAWVYNPLVFFLMVWFFLELGRYIWYANYKLDKLLKFYRWFLAGLAILLLLLRCFKYFPLP